MDIMNLIIRYLNLIGLTKQEILLMKRLEKVQNIIEQNHKLEFIDQLQIGEN